jgi:hypothetical protein
MIREDRELETAPTSLAYPPGSLRQWGRGEEILPVSKRTDSAGCHTQPTVRPSRVRCELPPRQLRRSAERHHDAP